MNKNIVNFILFNDLSVYASKYKWHSIKNRLFVVISSKSCRSAY